MPQSMDVKRMVKEGGYTILAWALRILVEHEQYQLAAMIIIVLCLAPRKTELQNNGILAVLRNFKLSQLGRNNTGFKEVVFAQAEDSAHYDKIDATLVATGWWENYNFNPCRTDPLLWNDDGIMYFESSGPGNEDHYTHGLCDHAGSQSSRYFQHFRLVLDYNGDGGVRVIGKQMDRDSKTMSKATPLTNGYYEYRIPSSTVIHRMHPDLCGRTLEDVMEPGVWYNYRLQPDTVLHYQ